MLVISRYKDESIILELQDIKIVVKLVRCSRDKASIGIQAPQTVHIIRGELCQNNHTKVHR